MRLIGAFDTEKEAYTFYSFLLKEGVQNVYEPFQDEEKHKKRYRVWVFEEDDLDHAVSWFQQFQKNPNDPAFQNVQIPLVTLATPPSDPSIKEANDPVPSLPPRIRRRRFQMVLTQSIIEPRDVIDHFKSCHHLQTVF